LPEAARAELQRYGAAPVELSTEIQFAGENSTQQLRLADKRHGGVPGRNVTPNPLCNYDEHTRLG
jgi:hypothetical protein